MQSTLPPPFWILEKVLYITYDFTKIAVMYIALCQNLKFFLVDLRLKTFETELKRI